MSELQWDTKQFNNPKYFSANKQPFVYSFGGGSVPLICKVWSSVSNEN